MDRRKFLIHAANATAATLAADQTFGDLLPNFYPNYPSTEPPGLSILQGYTTESETQLSICVNRFEQVVYTLKDVATKKVIEPVTLNQVTYGTHLERVDKIKYAGLQLGHRYNLTVHSRKWNKQIDSRFLTTVDFNKANPKIALMACMKDFFVIEGTKNAMWESARAANPDYLFFIGDSVYGDALIIAGPNFLWERYIESRKSIPFYRWKNLKPVLATWDDHDFGQDNGDGKMSFKAEALSHFRTFFAQESDKKHLFKGHANSLLFRAFGQNFAFFDNRYYRGFWSEEKYRTFLGKKQIDWMMDGIAQNPLPTLVMQGAPTFGRSEKKCSYHHNSPQELQYFLTKLKDTGAPAVFAGGDLHYSEVSKIDKRVLGYDTAELITGCMHSNTKDNYYDNPNPRLGGSLQESFLMLERPGTKSDPVWQTSCITPNKRIAFQNRIKLG